MLNPNASMAWSTKSSRPEPPPASGSFKLPFLKKKLKKNILKDKILSIFSKEV
jgi:hypothetical protein